MKGSPTAHPHYINDGRGRDTYISFSNGGFSSYPYSNSYKKDFYEVSNRRYHADLFKNRPIIKYDQDGSGRDFFIYQNILSDHDRIQGVTDFPNMLRAKGDYYPYTMYKSNNVNKFEKNLINRIYYSRSPKNKTLNKQEKNKEDEKENTISEQKSGDNTPSYKNVENNKLETDPSLTINNGDSKNVGSFKKSRRKKSESNNMEKPENLTNSIRAIFMFNNKKKNEEKEKGKEGNKYWI